LWRDWYAEAASWVGLREKASAQAAGDPPPDDAGPEAEGGVHVAADGDPVENGGSEEDKR